jgi:hypothetical protein
MKEFSPIPIDISACKAALKSEYDNGYIDNLRYIEILAWLNEYEKEKNQNG